MVVKPYFFYYIVDTVPFLYSCTKPLFANLHFDTLYLEGSRTLAGGGMQLPDSDETRLVLSSIRFLVVDFRLVYNMSRTELQLGNWQIAMPTS